VKYGAFSNKAGSVSIIWTIEPSPEGNRLVLCWQEKGGPRVTPPSRKGFGTRVIERGLAHELEGTAYLDYRLDGLVCTISFPAPPGARNG
jgi:two-component sensor histidine kinase